MMKLEEAIELKAAVGRLMYSDNKDVRDYNALIDFIESALRPVSREQVEKWRGEWQICFEDWRKQMAGDQCSKCGFQHYGTSINHYKFCPNCGAPMTDEAVQMVMERSEALKDAD